jgi:parallel beta-helix repeat protein
MCSRIFNFILTALLLVPTLAGAETLKIEVPTVWQGQVELSDSVFIDAQGVLTIKAGTRVKIGAPEHQIMVYGRLLIEGTESEPVIFDAVAQWQGIHFVEAAAGSVIRYAQFRDCRDAVSVIAASPQITNSQFLRCDAGIKLLRESNSVISDNIFSTNNLGLSIEMRSNPRVTGNQFFQNRVSGIVASNKSQGLIEKNIFEKNQQAIGLMQPYTDHLKDNIFRENQVGIYCYQTQNTPTIEQNLFEKNELALVNFSFSFPVVHNNKFIDNQTALKSDQFGSAAIEHNLFQNNETAIYLNRKSNARIKLNQFTHNKLAMLIDYSSYPQVQQNNFDEFTEAVRLGIYQSADWEKRSGSKPLQMKEAKARGSKNPTLVQAPEQFNDVVDLSSNWWGEQHSLLSRATNAQNLSQFYDRKDLPTVVYEGFGPDAYVLDEIHFQPVLGAPVSNAGLIQ